MVDERLGKKVKFKRVIAEDNLEAVCEKLFTIQEVAGTVFTSTRNLQRAFSKHNKYTPMQFLYNRKLIKARKVLLSNNNNNNNNNPFAAIKEVVLKVGILDLNQFGKNYSLLFSKYPNYTLRK